MNKKSPIKGVFNAKVVYQKHSNPPVLGLRSDELGYAEAPLRGLKLTPAEIDALSKARAVAGTYETLASSAEIYHPIEGMKKSTWKVTSLKPSGFKSTR